MSKKDYYKKNKDIILNRGKEYYKNNKDFILKRSKEYYINNKESIKDYQKQYRDNKPLTEDKKTKNKRISKTIQKKYDR